MGVRRWWAARREPEVGAYAAEGVLHAETAAGTLTFRGYRGPATREQGGYQRSWVRWTVVLTRRRLVVVRGRRGPVVNVPWTDPRAGTLRCSVDRRALLIGADAARFRPGTTGTIEVRAEVADPAALLALLDNLRSHGRR